MMPVLSGHQVAIAELAQPPWSPHTSTAQLDPDVPHTAACWAASHDAVIWAFKVVGLGFYPD